MSNDRAETKAQEDLVNDLLDDWDFLGVSDEVSREYDCMTQPLVRLLHEERSARTIRAYVSEEITDHFGMGRSVPPREVKRFVRDLRRTWRDRYGT